MRKLMWFSIGFGAACALGAYLYAYVFISLAAASLVTAGMLAVLTCRIKALRVPAMILFAFAIGICWFILYDKCYLFSARQMDGETVVTEIEVTDYSYNTGYGTGLSGFVSVEGIHYQVLAYLDGEVLCGPGDRVYGSFRFRFTSEGCLNEPTYHRSEGLFLLAYQDSEVIISEPEVIPLRCYPAIWREKIQTQIDLIFPKDAAAFGKALLLGYRYDIDYETNTAFKLTGISHIVSVSGLHVSILFSLVYLFSGRKRFLLLLIGIPVLFLFAAVAGFTPSITRACIMQLLMLLALLTDREYDPPTALGFAALVMLCLNPMVITSISFQLTMGCMIGIFLFYQRIHDWLLDSRRLGNAKGKGFIPRLKRWFASSVSVSMSASVVTTPIVAYHFGTVSLISLLTNLLLVWMVSYIFYGIMLACILSLVSVFVGRLAAWVVVLPIRIVTGTAKLFSKFPLAAVYTQSEYIAIWLVSLYLLLAVFLCMKKKPALLFGCCAGISLCAALLAGWTGPLLDTCRVTVLDVGQGQCILLQSEGRTFLVDCGGDSGAESADLAAQTLLCQGISRLDGIIVTHYDADHAGGIPFLLTRISSDAVFLPDIADDDGLKHKIKSLAGEHAIEVSCDLTLTYGETTLTIFGPESYHSGNESSLCILFQTENCDILITGDRGAVGEFLLLRRAQLPQLEVLIAGHHGSANSTGEALLEAANPEYVLISAGKNNIYGHPAADLLDRLDVFGCIVFRTDQNGTIIFRR